MKPRPVAYIHVAAYVLSALVLACSAFSYCRAIVFLNYRSSSTFNRIYFDEGHLLVWRFSERPRRPFKFQIVEPFPIEWVIRDFSFSKETSERRFLTVRYLSNFNTIELPFSTSFNLTVVTSSNLTVVPFWLFLLPPMAWMCGFYLVKLRQRFRRRTVTNQPGAS